MCYKVLMTGRTPYVHISDVYPDLKPVDAVKQIVTNLKWLDRFPQDPLPAFSP